MQPPELLTPDEERLLSAIVETTLDFDCERRHIHEENKWKAYEKQQDRDEDTTSNFE